MDLKQRTLLRVVVFGLLFVGYIFYSWQAGMFSKENATPFGVAVILLGLLAFYFHFKFKKTNQKIQAKLAPTLGHALPEKGQVVVLCLILAAGTGLVLWGQLF
jgi:hypothetical protein